jgi:hypothetical protein
VGGWQHWPDKNGQTNWMKRFLNYLRERKALKEFSFFSFEWYPVDNLDTPPSKALIQQKSDLINTLQFTEAPKNIPWYISEYGYSSSLCPAEVDLPGAIMDLDIALSFLEMGGKRAYFYGYEPDQIMRDSSGQWGALALLAVDSNGEKTYPLPAFYAAKMMTQLLFAPQSLAPHAMLAVKTLPAARQSKIGAYAVKQPNGQIGVMLLNKDDAQTFRAQIRYLNENEAASAFKVYSYSSREYIKAENGLKSEPAKNMPPSRMVLQTWPKNGIDLPPFSITLILRRSEQR